MGKALNSFHKKGEAERAEENPIDKCSKNLCSVPSIRILGGGGALRQLVVRPRINVRSEIAEKCTGRNTP